MLISNNYYNYVYSIIQLVGSFILHSVYDANAMNKYLNLAGEDIPLSKTQWKYYLNLAGIPYVGKYADNSDPSMTVFSLDTNQTIPFTVESLANSPMTLQDLRSMGTNYKTLVNAYPNTLTLINGIINPVPLDISIVAEDYQILYYNSAYLSPNETQLINKVQKFIYNFTTKYDNGNYYLTDPLYPASFIGVLFTQLPLEIINIRIENCKTPQVHEWHVWNYLSSYFDLAKHKGIIPYEQALFLYRNIDYIIANSGSNSTLNYLNEKFAKPFNLKLSTFEVQKDLGNSLVNLNNGNLKQLDRYLTIIQYPYGNDQLQESEISQLSPKQFVNKLINSGLNNDQFIDRDIQDLTNNGLNSLENSVITSVIEGDVANNILYSTINKTEEQIFNWFYLSSLGFIKFKITLDLVDVGIKNLIVNAQDAAVLYMYAFNHLIGNASDNIPEFQVFRVMVSPTASESEIKSVVEPKYLTIGNNDIYSLILDSLVYPSNCYSLSDFNNYALSVVNAKFYHLTLIECQGNYIGRSELHDMLPFFYKSINCSFITETTYSDFFKRLNVKTNNWTSNTFVEILKQITNNYIGVQLETGKLQSPYSNMLDILTQICSYTLTFIPGYETDYAVPMDPGMDSLVVNGSTSFGSSFIEDSSEITIKSNLSKTHAIKKDDIKTKTKSTVLDKVFIDNSMTLKAYTNSTQKSNTFDDVILSY